MNEITTADLQKLADAQSTALATIQMTLANLSASVELLLALESATLAEKFGLSPEQIAEQLRPMREKFVQGAHDAAVNVHATLTELKRKRRQGS